LNVVKTQSTLLYTPVEQNFSRPLEKILVTVRFEPASDGLRVPSSHINTDVLFKPSMKQDNGPSADSTCFSPYVQTDNLGKKKKLSFE
jgi:hypothetical protein